MASSEKKRAREQKAAARRERVAQKRLDKAADRDGTDTPWTAHDESPEQNGETAPPTEGEA